MTFVEITNSSQIAGAAWTADADGCNDGTLVVRFRSGAVYEYAHVARAWWEKFRTSVRPGQLFMQIKNNAEFHPYRRLPSVDAHTEKTA